MTKQRKILYLVSVALLVLVLLLCVISFDQNTRLPLSFCICTENTDEEITVWQSETGEYYAFFPGYTDLSNVKMRLNTSKRLFCDNIQMEDGTDCGQLQFDMPYSVTYCAWGIEQMRTLTLLRSSCIAAMFINTQSGNMDYIHEEKGNSETGQLRVYSSAGQVDFDGIFASIQGRGNYTWGQYDKKAYSLELNEPANLLQIGAAKRWILLANAGDPTHLRNKIVYDFSDAVGLSYAPDTEAVDLYLNGEYAGLYLLSERNEVQKNRVNIAEEGSFLVSQELQTRLQEDNNPYVVTNENVALRIHYPLNPNEATEQNILQQIQSVESALFSERGIDPLTGKTWLELIDLESWVRKYLIEEIFGNGDAGAISQYYYIDGAQPNGKLYAGPVWDYDHSMGNPVDWCLVFPNVFFGIRNEVTPWFTALSQKQEFEDRVKELYQTEYLLILEKLLQEDIWRYSGHIAKAVQMDALRWGGETAVSNHVDNIVTYMQERQAILNEIWIHRRSYCRVLADKSIPDNRANYIAFTGEPLSELYWFESTEYLRFIGWYDKTTGEPFDTTQPITRDMEIYAKWEEVPSNLSGKILKLIPLGMIAVLGVVLLVTDHRRAGKNR